MKSTNIKSQVIYSFQNTLLHVLFERLYSFFAVIFKFKNQL